MLGVQYEGRAFRCLNKEVVTIISSRRDTRHSRTNWRRIVYETESGPTMLVQFECFRCVMKLLPNCYVLLVFHLVEFVQTFDEIKQRAEKEQVERLEKKRYIMIM